MDQDKLRRLRELFGEAGGGDVFDPEFRRVADLVFAGSDRRPWPFAGVATFAGAPYRPDAPAEGFAGLDVGIVGIPMDLGVTNRAGARLGPRAVRAVERIGPYEHVLKVAPFGEARVADLGDLPMASRYSLDGCHADIEAYIRGMVEAGVKPLSVGGDHSIGLPLLRAIGRDRPVGMIHIDAHCDTSGEYEGTKFHHGGPFRQAVLDGVLDPERTIQIGIRGGAEYLWEFSYASGMTVIHAEEAVAMGFPAVIAKAREVVGDGPTYITFDVDSLDPGFAPGTGTPEVGGFAPREVLEILRGLVGLHLVGADVVEVAPQYDATANTAHAAAQVMFTLLCLLVRSPAHRGNGPSGHA